MARLHDGVLEWRAVHGPKPERNSEHPLLAALAAHIPVLLTQELTTTAAVRLLATPGKTGIRRAGDVGDGAAFMGIDGFYLRQRGHRGHTANYPTWALDQFL